MELVVTYLKSNYVAMFSCVKDMWEKDGIQSTPEIATIIEDIGISRHMYKKAYHSNESYRFEGMQEFYKMCLGFLLYLIDQQEFNAIPTVFEYEQVVHKYNEEQSV